jgi:predicted RNase H-like HicB family nuclease
MRYAARITTRDNGKVTVRVPDVQGAIASGDTEAEALRRAQRLVLIILEQLMIEDGPLPKAVAHGESWIDIPSDSAATFIRYSARSPVHQHGVRSLISMLLETRKRELTGGTRADAIDG